MVEAKPR